MLHKRLKTVLDHKIHNFIVLQVNKVLSYLQFINWVSNTACSKFVLYLALYYNSFLQLFLFLFKLMSLFSGLLIYFSTK